jgi:glutaredoxin
MIGKRSSLRILLRCLRILGVSHVFSTRFMQGKKGKSTVRWGVAWTFLSVQVPPSVQHNMSHKVFGLKKLRQRRDVCTEVRSIAVTGFLSTVDPKEKVYLENFSLHSSGLDSPEPHALDFGNFVNFLKTQTLGLTVSVLPTSLPLSSVPKRWSDCTCHHCIFALSFLRIWLSVSNHPSFHFHRVDVEEEDEQEDKRKRNSKKKNLEIFFILDDENSSPSSVELCVSVRAHVALAMRRGAGAGGEREDSGEKRRRNSGGGGEPISKRIRIETADTRWETSSSPVGAEESESEDEDEDGGSDEWQHGSGNEEEAESLPPTAASCEVEHLEFSISLNQMNRNLDSVISPALR